MRYVREVPRDDDDALTAETAHVRALLSATASPGDDPDERAGEVQVWTADHPTDAHLLLVGGELAAEPVAPYLSPGYDPFVGIEPSFVEEVLGSGSQ